VALTATKAKTMPKGVSDECPGTKGKTRKLKALKFRLFLNFFLRDGVRFLIMYEGTAWKVY
jgi:hypothetical protein